MSRDIRALVSEADPGAGRVEVSVSVQLAAGAGARCRIQRRVRSRTRSALDRARERGLIVGTLTPGDLLRLPQAITVRERTTDDRVWRR
ncbi:MAG: hypothetical protein QM736_25545 [Vicinamibacterales bacterium]